MENKSSKKSTKEVQYNVLLENELKLGRSRLGLMTNTVWHDDPRRLVFSMARYKFISKMLEGKKTVLEVGCGDAFCSRIVQQTVQDLSVADFDQVFIDDIESRLSPEWPVNVFKFNALEKNVLEDNQYDAIYSLDVLEHISTNDEDIFVNNLFKALKTDGVMIVGMPSLESQKFASTQSKIGHVNCKSGKDLKGFFSKYFSNVFLFSMNDEVVHTGFTPMAHYLIVVCCNKQMIL